MPKPADLLWTETARFPDCAVAGLGDPGLVNDHEWLSHGLPCVIVRRSGLGMLYGKAESDGLPVEIGQLAGVTVAARLEFTSDVRDVEAAGAGQWEDIGRLRVGRRGAIAVDLKVPHRAQFDLPLPPGWYRAEVFMMVGGDHLGIRLISEGTPTT
jgi:hypothetical protein